MKIRILSGAILSVVVFKGLAIAQEESVPNLSVSDLSVVQGPIMLNGMPVNDQHPLAGSTGFEKLMDATSRFEMASDCLEGNDYRTIAADVIDDEYELNVCIQRIAEIADDPAAFASWLRAAGFRIVSHEVASRGALTFGGIQISPSGHAVGGSWRDQAGGPDFSYPLSRSFNVRNALSIRNLSVLIIFDENNDLMHSWVSINRL